MEMLAALVSKLWVDGHKERHEMLLEPLQAMMVLSMLAFCPVGTKLSIVGNLAEIQTKSWTQPVKRAYRADGKEDLVYLFGVIRRFNIYYAANGEFYEKNKELVDKLKLYGKVGLERLTETYSGCENGGHLAQTLKMYNSMLTNYPKQTTETNGIDDIFHKIVDVYNANHLAIMAHTLVLLSESPSEHHPIIRGFGLIMEPLNRRICTWISENITM